MEYGKWIKLKAKTKPCTQRRTIYMCINGAKTLLEPLRILKVRTLPILKRNYGVFDDMKNTKYQTQLPVYKNFPKTPPYKAPASTLHVCPSY